MSVLFVAWRGGENDSGVWGPVGRLGYDGQVYRFCYTQGARTLRGFQPFPSMEDLEQVYVSETLFPLFANRLLSPSRPEYEAFLRWGGFDPNNPPSPLAILGVTEGIRQTDSIEVFPCPTPDAAGCYFNRFFLHGIRWMPSLAQSLINQLQPEQRLILQPEPLNVADRNAVAVYTEFQPTQIGYVPRYLAHDVGKLVNQCDYVELVVERLNSDAPLQQRLLCCMHSCWPEGFRPCSGEDFLPIPADVPTTCKALS
jgi:hypothetical protein